MTDIAIVAGNAKEAKDFARSNKIENWFYVSRPHRLLGFRGRVERVGSYLNRKDIDEIELLVGQSTIACFGCRKR